jgi:hypothetical protein
LVKRRSQRSTLAAVLITTMCSASALASVAGCSHAWSQESVAIKNSPAMITTPPAIPTMRSSKIIPPLEYDKPYEGLGIARGNKEAMLQLCRKSSFPIPLGCARLYPEGGCVVYIADDTILQQFGWTYEVVLRHERCHCFFWPADHKGARTIEQAERDQANGR